MTVEQSTQEAQQSAQPPLSQAQLREAVIRVTQIASDQLETRRYRALLERSERPVFSSRYH